MSSFTIILVRICLHNVTATPPQLQYVCGKAVRGSTRQLACKLLWRIISNVCYSRYKIDRLSSPNVSYKQMVPSSTNRW